jgi:alanyl-tRNA synthetase
MTASELRRKYLDFFKRNGHAVIPSASLIPENDSTTLFISSGMQPMVPYLMGEKHPLGIRICDFQKSFRIVDIEEVGDGRHNTFFEMLGNWSLGDYFKKEQLPWIYSFLINEVGLSADKLYATVFRGEEGIGVPKDSDSVQILKNIFKKYKINAKDVDFAERDGMQEGRIFYYPAEKNWWSRSGIPEKMPIGEIGGSDSEIFYDFGAELKKHENSQWKDLPCHVNCDCGRFIEIGNSVFMEYKKTEKGFEKLAQQNVDFGGGLERITMASQNTDDIFKTDLFLNIIKKIEQLSRKNYSDDKKSFEIVADHLRAATFIIGDSRGIAPSNIGQGYIIRRLIRRAIRFGKILGIKENLWTKEIAKIIIEDYENVYNELSDNSNFIVKCLDAEEEKFGKTLDQGLKEFGKQAELSVKVGDIISGKDAFNLYQTYGFPIEVLVELANERNIKVDMSGFKKEVERHQELSRTASAGMFKGGLADNSEQAARYHTATHLLLASLRKILGDHIFQKGSNITAERMRFDFSHPQKIEQAKLKEIEDLVNSKIKEGLEVKLEEMPIEKARESGAMGVFGEKYGQTVRVYSIINKETGEIFSKEMCGGPHVGDTSELGTFKIIKEEACSAGVRRIKAILE